MIVCVFLYLGNKLTIIVPYLACIIIMKIKVFKNSDDIGCFIGELLVKDTLAIPNDGNYSVLLSGGSTPKAIFSYLAEKYHQSIQWHLWNVFWGDERCVPPSDSESNYRMAKEMLLSKVDISPDHVFRIRGEDKPAQEAMRYASLVSDHLPSRDGIPVFDLVFLGLGDDGHTASIFPDQLQLFDSEKFFEVATHPTTRQTRITATGRIINQASKIVFVVTGQAKADVVSQIIERKNGWEELPASLINPECGELLWLLDEHAASELNKTTLYNSQ